jgi:hypothetical protein
MLTMGHYSPVYFTGIANPANIVNSFHFENFFSYKSHTSLFFNLRAPPANIS